MVKMNMSSVVEALIGGTTAYKVAVWGEPIVTKLHASLAYELPLLSVSVGLVLAAGVGYFAADYVASLAMKKLKM